VFKILKGVYAERADPAFLTCPQGYAAGFLSETQIRQFALNPENEMSETFVEEALSRGDQCFAICVGAALAAYGWYSFRPTPIGLSDLYLRFGPSWVYMYKGYTHPRYRGERLHAIGMSMALQHYVSNGFRGLVSYVESTNFDSLRSVFRMGYQCFGSVYIARLLGRFAAACSPGCEKFQFRVAPKRLAAPCAPVMSQATSRPA